MKGKVLVIEDDKKWQKILHTSIEEGGYYVHICSSRDEALEIIKHEKFHFMTIDMSLIDENAEAESFEGWDVLKLIKELQTETVTPTIVITGYEKEYKELSIAKHLNAIFFMGKGEFDNKKLLAIIDREVERINLRFNNDHRTT